MSLFKKTTSKEPFVIASNNKNDTEKYPPGYKYELAGTIYTIKRAFVENNTEMREIEDDRGDLSIVSIATIDRDHNPEQNLGIHVHTPKNNIDG